MEIVPHPRSSVSLDSIFYDRKKYLVSKIDDELMFRDKKGFEAFTR